MKTSEIRKRLDDLVAEFIRMQYMDPVHKDEWEKMRIALTDAMNTLNTIEGAKK